jgi:arylsulfatase A-like enzyme/Flp pilus assembly protein TadD
MRTSWRSCLLLAGCAALAAGCGESRWNLVVVTFDTTRADALAAYGNPRVATPAIDALAREGYVFEDAHSSVPLTLPAHTTLLTGTYPLRHGVRDNGLFVVPAEVETLAERLQRAGWATAAAVGGFPLAAKFGIAQGFDFYDDQLTRSYEDLQGHRVRDRDDIFFDERKAERVNEALYPWLEEHAQEPFFLWAHYYDPHQPLEPPPPYDELYADDLYAGEIAYADETLGTLLAELRRLGVWDRTLVAFTADHGEGRGEHRELTHSYLLYETTLHVPLILRMPGGNGTGAPVRIPGRVHHVDLVPTLLELLGLPVPDGMDGASLVPALHGARSSVGPRYAETLSPRLSHGWGELRAVWAGEWKYIHGPRPELFHLPTDPRELRNLVGTEPAEAARLEGLLERLVRDHAAERPLQAAAPDPDTRRRLEALGYVQGGGAEFEIREVLSREGVPPQDRADETSDITRVKEMLVRQQPLAAREAARRLLAEDPQSPFFVELLARAEAQLGHLDEALALLERLVGQGTTGAGSGRLLLEMGRHLDTLGRREEAREQLARSTELDPTAEGFFLLGTVESALGRTVEARDAWTRAVEADGGYGPALVALALERAREGDREEAEGLLRQAVEQDPYYPRGSYNLGALLLEGGQAEPAAALFERAVSLAPNYLEAYYAAAVARLRLGEREQAEALFERLAARAPASQEARDLRALLDAGVS